MLLTRRGGIHKRTQNAWTETARGAGWGIGAGDEFVPHFLPKSATWREDGDVVLVVEPQHGGMWEGTLQRMVPNLLAGMGVHRLVGEVMRDHLTGLYSMHLSNRLAPKDETPPPPRMRGDDDVWM